MRNKEREKGAGGAGGSPCPPPEPPDPHDRARITQGSYVGREASRPMRFGARPLGRCGARTSKAREFGASKTSGAGSAGRGARPDRSGAVFRRSRRHYLERA